MCGCMNVSSSGYDAWLRRPINTCKLALKKAVHSGCITHQARVGAPSITYIRTDEGWLDLAVLLDLAVMPCKRRYSHEEIPQA